SSPSTCPTPLSLLFFFFKSSSPPRDLHSFPTRRSSDLIGGIPRAIADAPPLGVVDEVLDRLAVGAFEFEQDELPRVAGLHAGGQDRKSTRLNSSHLVISYAVFCLKKKKITIRYDVYCLI